MATRVTVKITFALNSQDHNESGSVEITIRQPKPKKTSPLMCLVKPKRVKSLENSVEGARDSGVMP